MSDPQTKALEAFIDLQNRNGLVHVIRSAVELGVIRALRSGQKTIAELAEELDLQPVPLTRLMNVLAETELVERYGDHYALSPVGKLIPESFLDFGDHYWQHLSDYIRTGTPLPDDPSLPHREADFHTHRASQEWTHTAAALDAAAVLGMGEYRKGQHILEIGCRSAVFGLSLAYRDPDAVLTLLDCPEELNRARPTIESLGLNDRVVLIPTDRPFDLPTISELQGITFDLVLIAEVIQRLDASSCKELFVNIFPLVKPQGDLAIIDVFPGQEKGRIQQTLFELELGLRTSHGQLHDPRWLESVLKEVGFAKVEYAHLPAAPSYWGLMLASRA